MAHKHLGLTLDEKLSFTNCINDKINKTLKGVGLLRKLSTLLPRQSLLTIYKSFIRPHLDYGDIIYDQPLNESLSNRIESVQYKAALAITGAIQGSSRKKLYQELGLEHLHQRQWMRRLCLFYKVFQSKVPNYIHSLIPSMRTSARPPNTFTSFYCRTKYFQNSFLPYVIKEGNKLDPGKRNSQYYESFRKTLLNFIRPSENKMFNILDQVGIKLLTRLRLGLSQLREHKFRHNFKDNLNPLCCCSIEAETTLHFFLRCQFFNDIREILMNDLINIIELFLVFFNLPALKGKVIVDSDISNLSSPLFKKNFILKFSDKVTLENTLFVSKSINNLLTSLFSN